MKKSHHQTEHVTLKRQDRLIRESDHDPYHSRLKLKGPTVCPDCGAVYDRGRWSWKEADAETRKQTCPACQRIADRVPAAFLTIRGEFLQNNKDEILNLIRNYEAKERQEHPMKRIMASEELADGIQFTFSDAHLARGIGEALQRAYEGEIDYQYTKEDIMLRVTWMR